MPDPSLLPDALDAELDEVLGLVPLTEVVPGLADRVFQRLTEGLAEAVLYDVRARHESGKLDRGDYLTERCRLVVALEEHDLLRSGAAGPEDR